MASRPYLDEIIRHNHAGFRKPHVKRAETPRRGVRRVAISALIAAILLPVSFSLMTPSPATSVVDSNATGEERVVVGWMQTFQNWNPLNIRLVSEWVATFLVYSTLFQYDEDYNRTVNHLATDYYQVQWPSGNMSTYINITHDAYFRNRDNPEDTSHPLTAHDISYTVELIQDNPGGSWDYYVANITGVYVLGPYQVKIDTDYPKATLIDDLVWVPILPEFWWSNTSNVNPGHVLLNLYPLELIGSGPFYVDEYVHDKWYNFTTAPSYHCTADYGDERDIDVDGISYAVFPNVDALTLAFNAGHLDVVDMTGALTTWKDIVGAGATPAVKQATSELGIYDMAINGIPLEMRTEDYGSGSVILLDPVVRKALGMTLDRQTLADDHFDGIPVIADTVINPGYWHANLADYTEVLPFNPAWARENLTAAGYADLDGDPDHILEVTADTDACNLYGAGIGEPLEFRLRVPDSDPWYKTIGEAWVGWAKDAGIKLNFQEVPEALMINFDWYQADFDVWVWAWYWGPEPLSNLAVFRTEEVTTGGDSTVGPIGDWWWVNEGQKIAQSEYDVVFEQALRTIDKTERKAYVDELQVMIYDEYVEFPPLYTVGLYAWTEGRFVGWGDWENHTARSIISAMLWLWYDLEPAVTNSPPIFNTPLPYAYEAALDVPITFTIGVSDPDGDPLEVNWSFGDGSPFAYDWITDDTTVEQIIQQTHTYTETANGLTLRVALSDGQHVNEVVEVAEVNVIDLSNTPPVAVFAVTPEIGCVETVFKVNATASHDGEDSAESLEVRWDFDGDDAWDTEWTTEKVAYHQYAVPGNYTVKLEVRDAQGLTNTTTMRIEVWEIIPEFPFVVVPVLSITLIMVLAARGRLVGPRSRLRGN